MWELPDLAEVQRTRLLRLKRLREEPKLLASAKAYYKLHPECFINDWGMTADTRVASITGRKVVMPFVLFPKQIEWVQFAHQCWRDNEPAITVKSRDVGASWLAMALSCTLCLFYDDLSIGFGSATANKVDNSEDPDSLFYKGRMFLEYLPPELSDGWSRKTDTFENKILFRRTRASITGEAGDRIGRGGRKAMYFVDEAAHLEHPMLVEGGLQGNTDCRHDISSVCGTDNPFYEKFISGQIRSFLFTWRDDPRKDDAWYAKRKSQSSSPAIFAQEVECDFQASVEGILIPSKHISASVDLHKRLGITMTGVKMGAMDVADEGADKCAFAVRHGNLLTYAESWHGRDADMFDSVERAFRLADAHKLTGFVFDSDGLGHGVKSMATRINARRVGAGYSAMNVTPHRGSAAVIDPDRSMMGDGAKNVDVFSNYKAQCWMALALRFQAAFLASEGKPYKAEDIISINLDFPERARLCIELSQPTWNQTKSGKIEIDKKPNGAKSPDLADACAMLYAPIRPPMKINAALLEQFAVSR